MIRIKSKSDGFRRCGISHTGIKDYPDNAFTAKQVKELKAEPMLEVKVIKDKDTE